MTQLVEEIYRLARDASREEQYAAVNAILSLLEQDDSKLTRTQYAEIERRENLLKEGKMPVYSVEEIVNRIEAKFKE
ncbi:MAG: addiction module protein [Bacteroidota bacterium]